VWQVERLTLLTKIIVKNANTLAHGGEHLVVLAHLRRRWSLRGREGFEFLSPSHLGGIQCFHESEMHIFHYAGGKEFL
jgi:hypothetical protein